MEAVHTETYKEHEIAIMPDECGDSPREWDNLGTMVCFHQNYLLGDNNHGYKHTDFASWSELMKRIVNKEDAAVILPLYLYDHSGLSIKVGSFNGLLPQGHAEFDTMFIGYIFISKAKARYEYSYKYVTKARKKILTKYLTNEVETYNQFLGGDVYGYQITKDGEDVDSCWGFYGIDECLKEAKSSVDATIKHELNKHGKQLELELS